MKSKRIPRIVIVGAGPSGIAAAAKLFETGFTNVKILEAQDKIGGRIYTTKLGDYEVDLGAQWVQGEVGNVIFDLANPHNLLKSTKNNYLNGLNVQYLDSCGDTLNIEVSRSFNEFYWNCLAEQPYALDTTETSIGSYIKKKFDESFKNYPKIMKEEKKFLHLVERAACGVDPDECWFNISTASFFKYYEGDQMINWKDRGFSSLLNVLLKRHPNSEKELPVIKNTFLNSEVVSIDYFNHKSSDPAVITTKNGLVFKADHVIVTIPLGVLKEKHNTLFHPPLPFNKTKAIEAFGFGNVAKIFLLFNEPFWETDGQKLTVYIFSWNDDELKMIENDQEKSWLLGLYRAHSVEHKPNVLELWVSGKYAKEMESLAEKKVFDHCMESLLKFFGKKYNVSRPIGMLRTQWCTNPYFRGAYSYRSVKAQSLGVSSDELEKPINSKLKILFAGEATSKNRHATVDGAIVSGWKAADRLIRFYTSIPG